MWDVFGRLQFERIIKPLAMHYECIGISLQRFQIKLLPLAIIS